MSLDLQGISDRIELDELITSYANSLDDRDWARMRDLFVPDATLDFTAAHGKAGGRDEIVTWFEGQVTREFVPDMQHIIANRSIRFDGDTATGRLDYVNPDIVNDGEGGQFLLTNGGRYTFEAARTDAGWRFTRFVGSIVWSQRGELFVLVLPDD
jgi:hypothetical protein